MVMGLTLLLLMPLGSCSSDDDDDDAGFIGTWERMESGDQDVEMKQVLVITATTFEVKMQMELLAQWLDFMVIKGTYTAEGDIMSMTVTQVGLIKEDLSGLQYFSPSDPEWDAILAGEVEMPESFDAKYSVSGDKLTIIFDDNEDGIYDPVEEGVVFTRA